MSDQMHGSSCSCSRCTAFSISAMRHDRHLEEPPEHPDDCACRECLPCESAVPVNDTHRCSGGPEEITDEEWAARHPG